MLPELLGGFLADKDNGDLWLTCEAADVPIAFCYASPETLTDGTWNMLAIAVLPTHQGQGAGGALVKQLEADLRDRGQRILIADTSGKESYAPTRAFYSKCGYSTAATIPDFWAEGDSKVTFWKSLK
jgi:ribosomal protein S18 acetylase RimI-like enzyme